MCRHLSALTRLNSFYFNEKENFEIYYCGQLLIRILVYFKRKEKTYGFRSPYPQVEQKLMKRKGEETITRKSERQLVVMAHLHFRLLF